MEIFQIHYLDCREPANRRILIREIERVLKCNSKPSIERLERFSKSVSRKYGMPVVMAESSAEKLTVSVRVGQDSYSVFECHSYYEALCKHILLVECYTRKERSEKGK